MITKRREGRELVALLAKPIIGVVAPEEEEYFDDLTEDFFARSRAPDRTLGAGLELWPDLFYILLFVGHTLDFLLHRLQARADGKRRRRVKKALLRAFEARATDLLGRPAAGGRRKKRHDLPELDAGDVEAALSFVDEHLSEIAGDSGFARKNWELTRDPLYALLTGLREPVDLDLIVETTTENGETTLRYTLHSPSGEAKLHFARDIQKVVFKSDPSRLFERAREIHREARSSPERANRELAALGRELYSRLFPSRMRDEYRRFRSSVRSIQITSDEPWIPWELIKPYDDSDPDRIIDDDFLCLRFELTRWLGERPAPRIELSALAAIDVGQAGGGEPMDLSGEECALVAAVAQRHSGVRDLNPPSPGTAALESLLRDRSLGLLHLVGHGSFDASDPDASKLLLSEAGNDIFRPRHLHGPLKTAIRRGRPLVFFDSPESARQGWSTDLAGWPARWVRDCRCGAFIGLEWEVDRPSALEFARVFYRRLEHGDTLGAATRKARKRLWELDPGNPSWSAFRVYAHANGRLSLLHATERSPDHETPVRQPAAETESGEEA